MHATALNSTKHQAWTASSTVILKTRNGPTSSTQSPRIWHSSLGLKHPLRWIWHLCVRGWAPIQPLSEKCWCSGTWQEKGLNGKQPLPCSWLESTVSKLISALPVYWTQDYPVPHVAPNNTWIKFQQARCCYELHPTSKPVFSILLPTQKVNWYQTNGFCCCNKINP